MVQYYEVVCKGGHVGSNNYFPMHLFIAAENGREAAAIARQAPRVKHDRKDSIISVCPLPYEDYIARRHEHIRNGYYRSHSKQEMLRLCPNISEQIISEGSKSDDAHPRIPLRIKNRKKYINRYLQPYACSGICFRSAADRYQPHEEFLAKSCWTVFGGSLALSSMPGIGY